MKKLLTVLLIAITSISLAAGTFTQKQVDDMIDRALSPFRQDVADGEHTIGSPQSITNGAIYKFTIDGAARNVSSGPAYMTDRWDTVNDKFAVPSEYDSPTYVGDIGWVFDPTSAVNGIATVTVWIDDAVPKVIRTYTVDFKGPSPNPLNVVTTWYFGSETGYDAKNDGIYFEVSFNADGVLYDKSAVLYHTQ